MNDTPGWASPGSAPSDGQDQGAPRPAEPADAGDATARWSKEQPPAGQWSPPSTPGPGGSSPGAPAPGSLPGWGGGQPGGPGHNGWGAGWGQPPAAAKPGVIPLRPLGIGEILDGAVSTMRAHWRTALGLTITVAVISQIAVILAQRYLLPEPVTVDPNADPAVAMSQLVEATQSSLLSLAPATVVSLIGILFTTAILAVVMSRAVLGRPMTLSEAWGEARPRLLPLLGLTLLMTLGLAAIMTVGILPGLLIGSGAGAALSVLGGFAACGVIVWLWVRFSLASPALVLERQGIVKSLRRSAKLVQGAWWRIFGVLLLTLVLTSIVSMIIGLPFGLVALAVDGEGLSGLLTGTPVQYGWAFLIISGIGAVIAAAITYPIQAGVTVLLYIDQRIRREALDLELGRAAGVPGYDTPRS
ncbi:glycerophosphoryl diester phosphodiesterase membrane domain-containing protein [Streptomyces sannanensis]|uniref:Glycerophosphoryl diester phosphodiesterase membrane domain-containing protein n=1 Tax=Streptomyces sannanensis TaxID=285536 RepID=A0ABP6SAN3_9ACTN